MYDKQLSDTFAWLPISTRNLHSDFVWLTITLHHGSCEPISSFLRCYGILTTTILKGQYCDILPHCSIRPAVPWKRQTICFLIPKWTSCLLDARRVCMKLQNKRQKHTYYNRNILFWICFTFPSNYFVHWFLFLLIILFLSKMYSVILTSAYFEYIVLLFYRIMTIEIHYYYYY